MLRYRLLDHAVPATWRSLAAARLRADWPSGNRGDSHANHSCVYSAVRELALALERGTLADARTGKNGRHALVGFAAGGIRSPCWV
jgi:hypothetical protein